MDCTIYRKFNNDLKDHTDLQLIDHFNSSGKNENRIYNLETLLENNIHLIYLDLDYYKEHNKDLFFFFFNDYIIDYLENRINDGREISSKLNMFKKKKQKLIKNKLKNQEKKNFFKK